MLNTSGQNSNSSNKYDAELIKNLNIMIEQRDLLVRDTQKDFESVVLHHARTRDDNFKMVKTAETFIHHLSDPEVVHVDLKRLDYSKKTIPGYIENFKSARAHNIKQIDICLVKILKYFKFVINTEFKSKIADFLIENGLAQATNPRTNQKREKLTKKTPQLLKKLLSFQEDQNRTVLLVRTKEISISLDKRLVRDLTETQKPEPSSRRDSVYISETENFDSIIQELLKIKEFPTPIRFTELDACIYDGLNLLLCYYYSLIINSYMSLNRRLDDSIEQCYQAELDLLKASTYIKLIQKDSKEVQQQINTFVNSFIARTTKKHKENTEEYLFRKEDPLSPDDIDAIDELMSNNCKEINEDINLAVNTINDFIDELSNTKRNNLILHNILSSIFAGLMIELSPSLSQLENLK